MLLFIHFFSVILSLSIFSRIRAIDQFHTQKKKIKQNQYNDQYLDTYRVYYYFYKNFSCGHSTLKSTSYHYSVEAKVNESLIT